jgi:hypothetical protein
MDIKDILPLVGVAFGWFLKELSDGFRQSSAEHARVGKVLVLIYQLHDELRRLKIHQEFIKDRPGSWTEYEQFRVRTARRYLDQRGNIQETVAEAVDLVSGRWPFDAVELGHIKVILTWYHKTDLSALASDHDRYLKALSSLEVSLDMAEQLLRRLVLKLARMHSLFTWIRVRWDWHRQKSASAKKNREFTEQLLTDLYDGKDAKTGSPLA